ncbi:unnamed protein product [Phytophthora fragariaefolia]|uniref:Unnamed protein product n=1 Tax=Phytophthora fragariaefolia TaxID=1490495 RepID=A0A9W6YIX3_9STRA|nr:unnamed protein product [Phytophthora fragariaefolia]
MAERQEAHKDYDAPQGAGLDASQCGEIDAPQGAVLGAAQGTGLGQGNEELRRHRDNAAHDARVAGLPPQLRLDTQWNAAPTSVVLYGMGAQYAEYTRATVDKMAVHIEQMIANVRASVLTLWPQPQVETFGSYSTGIWLARSDVDLVILDAAGVSDSEMTAEHLKELAKAHVHSAWAFFL